MKAYDKTKQIGLKFLKSSFMNFNFRAQKVKIKTNKNAKVAECLINAYNVDNTNSAVVEGWVINKSQFGSNLYSASLHAWNKTSAQKHYDITPRDMRVSDVVYFYSPDFVQLRIIFENELRKNNINFVSQMPSIVFDSKTLEIDTIFFLDEEGRVSLTEEQGNMADLFYPLPNDNIYVNAPFPNYKTADHNNSITINAMTKFYEKN